MALQPFVGPCPFFRFFIFLHSRQDLNFVTLYLYVLFPPCEVKLSVHLKRVAFLPKFPTNPDWVPLLIPVLGLKTNCSTAESLPELTHFNPEGYMVTQPSRPWSELSIFVTYLQIKTKFHAHTHIILQEHMNGTYSTVLPSSIWLMGSYVFQKGAPFHTALCPSSQDTLVLMSLDSRTAILCLPSADRWEPEHCLTLGFDSKQSISIGHGSHR
jgi:hypothetical protein